MTTRADEITRFFEGFRAEDVASLAEWYTYDATFRDPFNDVAGLPAIQSVYRHMFGQLECPQFRVTHTTQGPGHCWLVWDMAYGRAPGRGNIHGASLLHLAPDGRIRAHIDYWDAAGEVYAKVPVLGGLMRFLRSRIAAPPPKRG